MQYDIEDHPDLQDSAWIRGANRRAKREVRRQRRQARARRHSGKIIAVLALVTVGAVVFGLNRAGTFDNVSLPDAPDLNLPYSGVNVEQPFAGTHAEQWSEGERGIVLPSTDPAFEQVRQALIAARLDPATISELKPDRYLALLAPGAREQVSAHPRNWTTQLKPGTKLFPNGIRVSGTMTLGEKDGRQTVTADYVFAYAFEPPDPKKLFHQMEMIAAVREKITYAVTPEGLWPTEAQGHRYSIACKASGEGFLGPQFIEPLAQGGSPVQDEKKHFTVGGEVPTEDTCD
ncbi:hypothetical protein SAMN04488074_114157 [Lentzea albidocapillata subsp. violacea]|uniref:Uncharacterized protein n=1 Tax=Lentzea albidocapillata subsp. violacea TaxID=128104 RepID=A0A1G9NX07_9PSEU|nr:hypothetical protein [Lentzea albidocapillata]SDL90567.1 hypothetical protein SAMN04488074_114157 [Lentzea albidocapillata subsp. violacea]